MAWINRFISFFFLTSFLFFVAQEGFAQTSLLWRIQSDVTQTKIIDPYEGAPTPFPYTPEPEPVEVIFEPTAEDLENQREQERRNLLASEILSEIRNIMDNENAFNPDVTSAIVEGVIQGDGGKLALMDNRWFQKGDTLSVPIKAKARLNSLISTLSGLDDNLSMQIRDELEDRYREVKEYKLTIDEVGADYLNLKDADDRLHVINFNLNPR